MIDPFINKIVSASENIYEVTSVSGNKERMLSMLEWAREQRSQGFHMGIFFVNGTLTVHAPRGSQSYDDWLERDVEVAYIHQTRYFNRETETYGSWSYDRNDYYRTEAMARKPYDKFYTNHPYKNEYAHTKHRIVRHTGKIIVESHKE